MFAGVICQECGNITVSADSQSTQNDLWFLSFKNFSNLALATQLVGYFIKKKEALLKGWNSWIENIIRQFGLSFFYYFLKNILTNPPSAKSKLMQPIFRRKNMKQENISTAWQGKVISGRKMSMCCNSPQKTNKNKYI